MQCLDQWSESTSNKWWSEKALMLFQSFSLLAKMLQ